MLKDFSMQSAFMGLMVSFVGFSSSFAVVLQGLRAAGATQGQAASGLMAAAIAMGLCAIVVSLRDKRPVSMAWSTPGAALLVSSGAVTGGFSYAVGAFLISAIFVICSGLFRPLGRLVANIPGPLAAAMLAGILLQLCIAPFKAISIDPIGGIAIFLSWLIGGVVHKLLAIPAGLLAFILLLVFQGNFEHDTWLTLASSLVPKVEFVTPQFSVEALFSIALPLFVVTMASQNIPGVAVMKSYGVPLKPGFWFTISGVFSLLAAPFGSHAVNLAAITAAMCAGEDALADPRRRYWAATFSGIFYTILGLTSGAIIYFVSLAPSIYIEAIAGLALFSAFSASALSAFKDEAYREAAIVTFLMAASGASILGIGGAFWGLIAGGLVYWLKRTTR